MVRVPFLLCVILDLTPESAFQVLTPQKRPGRVLICTKKTFFWRLLHKESSLEKKTVKFQFSS